VDDNIKVVRGKYMGFTGKVFKKTTEESLDLGGGIRKTR
jgi:ribosomal protein L24